MGGRCGFRNKPVAIGESVAPKDWSGSAVRLRRTRLPEAVLPESRSSCEDVLGGRSANYGSLCEIRPSKSEIRFKSKRRDRRTIDLIGDYEAGGFYSNWCDVSRASKPNMLTWPAALYQVFTLTSTNGWRVYHYVNAQEHAETWMEDLNDEESEASVYRRVDWRFELHQRGTLRRSNTGEPGSCCSKNPTPHDLLANSSGTCSKWMLMAKARARLARPDQ